MSSTFVDDDRGGRVMIFYALAILGISPFGSQLPGGAAKYIGAPMTLCIGGIFCMLGALVFARTLPE
jgi:hypothetical protein